MGIEKKDPANFSPNVEIPAKVDSFRFWCQKVLPLVYDDSLSYYELLCKVVEYLNNAIADVNTLGTDVDNINKAYSDLQSYVNNYFSTLDVQEEINNKLDIMASDGSLSAIASPIISASTSQWLQQHITNPSNPPLDTSLTVSGAAADSSTIGFRCILVYNNSITENNITNEFNDLNLFGTSYRNNSIIRYNNISEEHVKNAPFYPLSGLLLNLTTESTSKYNYQLFISDNGIIYYRYNNGSWLSNNQYDYLKGYGATITNNNLPTNYRDLNNLILENGRNNVILRYSNVGENVKNLPTKDYSGFIISMAVDKNNNYCCQLAISDDNKMFYRSGTNEWKNINKEYHYYFSSANEIFNALTTLNNGIIDLYSREYDLYTGLFENLIKNDNTDRHWIKGNLVINGSNATLKCHIPGSVANAHFEATNATSIMDIRGGEVEVNNVIFDCYNTRYCVHYESLQYSDAYFAKMTFNNCTFKYSRNVNDLNSECIGLGANNGQLFNVKNCKFYNDIKGAIYLHGRDDNFAGLNMENCYVESANGYGVTLSQYTGNVRPVKINIVNSLIPEVHVQVQPGGNDNVQYEITIINSKTKITKDNNVVYLYEPLIFNTI